MRGCSVQRWSLSLGHWAGIHVRVHMFLLLFAVVSLAYMPVDLYRPAFLTLVVALVSLALHEAAHALAAIRVGGKVDNIILGPVGGLVSPRVPDEPEVQLFVALSGPIVHLSLVVVAAVGLALAGDTKILDLLHPLNLSLYDDADPSTWMLVGKLTLWINWMLMLLNLLPAYPFDGGPIFRAMLWPALGRRTARVFTSRAGMVLGILIAAAALLEFGPPELDSFTFVKLPLVMLGIFVFFSARQDLVSDWSEDLFDEVSGYRVRSDGLDLLEPVELEEDGEEAVLVEHQRRQGEPHTERRQSQEAYEDACVDDILARLHDAGMSQLSPEEIAILQRASARYKQRLHLNESN
ncbi:MAG: site-2 protease family protein [Pirellulales bacterium]